jgi:hypothetical protein
VHPRLAEMAPGGGTRRARDCQRATHSGSKISWVAHQIFLGSPTPSSISKSCLGSPLHAPRVPTDEQLDPMVAGSRLGGDKRRPQRWAPQGGPYRDATVSGRPLSSTAAPEAPARCGPSRSVNTTQVGAGGSRTATPSHVREPREASGARQLGLPSSSTAASPAPVWGVRPAGA